MSQHNKGSSKLLLDWTNQPKDKFVAALNNLMQMPDVKIGPEDWWCPDHDQHPKECQTGELPQGVLTESIQKKVHLWWLPQGQERNTPNWDFISSATIAEKSGLVIMEAKSHRHEFDTGAKRLNKGASIQSQQNHRHIQQAIAQANNDLQSRYPAIHITIDRHYQLANRIAYVWKFATLGIPVVLIFLGFIKDTEMDGYFQDKSDWTACMNNYIDGVFPSELLEKDIKCPPSFFRLLIRSL